MSSSKHRISIAFIGTLLLATFWLAVYQRPAPHHPYVVIEGPEKLQITFLLASRPRAADCEATTANIANVTQATCLACRVTQQQCLQSLGATQQRYLSTAPLDSPSVQMSTGVVVYSSPNAELSLAACRESERQAASGPQQVKCFPANTLRTQTSSPKRFDATQAAWGFLTLFVAGFAAWLACYLIIRYEHLHAHLSHDHTDTGPQKFHAVPTPRIGGIGIVAGLLAGGSVLLVVQPKFNVTEFGYLLLAGVPAFLGGIAEDITKKVSVPARLLLTMLAGAVGAWLLGAVLNRVDVPGLDSALLWFPFAVAFTVFAVGGVANAINIIDGYNGLAGGYAVIVSAALAGVAAQVGDAFVFTAALAMIGTLIGFLVWNWPRGRIFLGDGGAYLLGFVLAELSVLLVARNPAVSPWFPLLLMAYPVHETLFSIYRRKWLRGHTPGQPDALHLHQLIFSRLVRRYVGSRDPEKRLRRNNMVAPYVWIATGGLGLVGLVFWQQTVTLMVGALAFCAFYVAAYKRITRWRAPHHLMSGPRPTQ